MDLPPSPDFRPTVPELLRTAAERWGPRDCVVTPTERMTFAQLDDRSARLAAELATQGIGKGSRVGLLFPNGVDWVIAWAAAARLGAVTVPVNTFYQATELARFLRHSDLQVLLGVSAFLHHDYVARLEAVAPELAAYRYGGPLLLGSLPQLRRISLTGSALPVWASRLSVTPAPPRVDGGLDAVVTAMGEDVTPADPLLVTYTSGSTGEPKGVVHGHGPLLTHAFNLGALGGIGETCRIWTPMPLCWVGGFVFGLLRALTRGACFVTQETFDAGTALRLLADERVTDVAAWPGVTKALLEHADFPSTDLRALRAGLYEAVAPDRRPPDPGLAIGSLGMSETCGPHTFKTAAEEAAGAPEAYRGTFGRPVPGIEHRIVDPETGHDLPEGAEGEVLVRGYSLLLGLHKRDRATVFDADGWYHTGDRGYFRDGWFFFTGRQNDLIKTGGSNVAPAEVESLLLADDEVKLAFVVGVPDEIRGERVIALVVPSGGVAPVNRLGSAEPSGLARDGAALGESLRGRLRGRLSSYKIPQHILPITDGQVPWLVSQKVDRRALVALARRLLSDQVTA
ncbi:class I adenylate-forming enzyme family protein [Pseudofrankia inefficax]|uniref:AMP-dependent synthetase and ligase n=1 Tax=Pseudofrankia inefficax (strain DSM 45817 / CECT 9037 / DDB 130130 / EuI1c) TaxID=298654 RepID=E3J7V5_PSEI1|nr:class I adenylate-forming enzyme family protein [Pseudofrankia inefficax]ADP80859.1 AMP-dependent synthetase and ligase [Pseudofrankia inefficax]